MLICILLFIIYIFFILLCLYASTNLKPQEIHSQINEGVSIIVAIRNGESSLPNLINFLKKQDYSAPIEFILVDIASKAPSTNNIGSSQFTNNSNPTISFGVGEFLYFNLLSNTSLPTKKFNCPSDE